MTADQVGDLQWEYGKQGQGYTATVSYIEGLPVLTIDATDAAVGAEGYVNIINADQTMVMIEFEVVAE